MRLDKSEKIKLFGEGIITFLLMVLLYIAAFEILINTFFSDLNYVESYWLIGDVLVSIKEQQFVGLTPVILMLLAVIAGLVVYWRLKRRQNQYELQHIIKELHHIADGNYAHRIRGDFHGELGDIVDSIHMLVDSTVEAIEEERRIEKTKDELITNVSHDIRTPLTSIIGYLGLIEQERYDTKEELHNYASRAFSKSQQMKSLVDDLFEYAKVRQTDTPLTLIDFDMIQLIDQLIIDFEWEAQNNEMELRMVSDLDELMMQGDSEKIVRLLNNLISNAIKYGYKKNEILIEVSKTDSRATIRVKNIGEPLTEKTKSQVFERFYRVEKSRSQKISGTGLGLAISKSIVDLHQGSITAYTEDKWTVFEFSMPLSQYD